MSTQHTAGPWIYDAEDNLILTHDGRVLLEWVPRSNHAKSGGTTVAERNANGRLVAAAPDLLQALEELAELAARCDSWQSFPTAPLEKAYAAIAKATGSQE